MQYYLKAIEKNTRLTLFITSRLKPELKNYSNNLLQYQCTSLSNDRKFKLNYYAICFFPGEPLGINKLRINILIEHDEDPDDLGI